MKKKEFIKELEKRLSGLPKEDVEERVDFYCEIIDDKVEEGKTEEEAVAELGGIDKVVEDIAKDTSLVKLLKHKMKPKRSISPLMVVLLILGFPLWFPLLMVGLVLVLVFFVLLWALVIVTYSLEVALFAGSAMGFFTFFMNMFEGKFYLFNLSIGILGIGAGLLFIYICILSTKACFKINKGVLVGMKKGFIGGGR